MIKIIKRILKLCISPFVNITDFVITNFSDNSIGIYLRKLYFKYSLKNFGSSSKVCSGSRFFNKKSIHIGNNLSMANNVILDANDSHGIFIGNYVSISDGTYFRSANHKFDSTQKFIQHQGHECAEISYNAEKYSIIIEDDVWIGARVVLISGTHIRKGSVILSGSIVNKVIPKYEVWGGVPAKFISNR